MKFSNIPGYQDKYFINIIGQVMAGYCMREAARLMNLALKTVQNRVKAKTIDHFLVNNRVFIYDWAVSAFSPGRKKEDQIKEIDAYKLTWEKFSVTAYSLPMLGFFLDIIKKGYVEKVLEKISISKSIRQPKELLISKDTYIFSQKNKEGDTVSIRKYINYSDEKITQILNGVQLVKECKAENKEMSIEDFQKMKEDFFSLESK